MTKALARAWRWQRLLENGEYGNMAEPSAAERISRSHICRVLHQFLNPLPVEWEKLRDRSMIL